jgi:hypothetical protein
MAKTPLLPPKKLLEEVLEEGVLQRVVMEEAEVALVDALRIPLPNL